jgi:hypothetical protein
LETIRILITVKTYPTLSTKYEELVCTAGIREDGSWIRLYPIPFRKKPYHEQYRKYEWIELDVVKNKSDVRPETYRPYSEETEIRVVGKIGTEHNWQLRKQVVLQKVYTNLNQLIKEAKDRRICTSLATFKPTEIIDFTWKPVKNREWDRKKLSMLNQFNLFTKQDNNFNVVKKLPYKFSYTFVDDSGKKPTVMIEDWETGQLYWNCLKRYDDEKKACEKVREKYFDEFKNEADLYLFLGTTKVNHFRAPNPFIIIGTFHPKKVIQPDLFE